MTRTFVDSGLLIASVQRTPVIAQRAAVLLAQTDRAFLCSAFVRLEVMPKASYYRNTTEIAFYRSFFNRVVAWAEPLDRVVAEAERQGARHGLNALDALHVAAAVLLGADELVTTERPGRAIHRATDVRVVSIHPAVVTSRTPDRAPGTSESPP